MSAPSLPSRRGAASVNASLPPSVLIAVVGLCAIWGFGQITIKIGNVGISPLMQAGLRSVFASILVTAWIGWKRSGLKMVHAGAAPVLAVGLLFALEFLCLFQGMNLTSASRGSLLLYTAPFVVALGGHLILDDRLDRLQWLGLVLAFGGLALMLLTRPDTMATGAIALPQAAPTLTGDLLCLAAGIFWGATTLVIRATALRRESPERCLLYQLLVSAPILVGLSLLLGPARGEFGIGTLTPLVLAAFAYQVVVIAGFSYLAWFVLILKYSPGRLSAFTFLTPMFGVFMAVPLLGEPLYPGLLAALALTVVGLGLVNRPRAR